MSSSNDKNTVQLSNIRDEDGRSLSLPDIFQESILALMKSKTYDLEALTGGSLESWLPASKPLKAVLTDNRGGTHSSKGVKVWPGFEITTSAISDHILIQPWLALKEPPTKTARSASEEQWGMNKTAAVFTQDSFFGFGWNSRYVVVQGSGKVKHGGRTAVTGGQYIGYMSFRLDVSEQVEGLPKVDGTRVDPPKSRRHLLKRT